MTNIKINKICKKILLVTVVGFCLFFQKVNAQVQLLNTFDATNNGLVPTPGGTPSGTKVLADNGTWVTPSSLISLTTTGSSGPATLTGATLNIPNYTLAGLGGISNITGLLSSGTNTTLSGSGTSASPYVVDIPQSVATSASPAFTGATLSGLTGNTLVYANSSKALSSVTLGAGLSFNTTTGTLSAAGTGGTVIQVTSGNLSPLFTTSVATYTTTPAISYTLTNAGAYTIFGNNTNASAVPTYFSPVLASSLFQNQGTATTVLHGNASGAPSWGAVNLTTDVTGILPLANGGTNANLTAVNGGIVWSNGTQMQISAAGTSTYLLQSNGAAAPSWVSPTTLVGNTAWLLGGNSNVTTGSYLGSQAGNDVPLVFKVNGVQAGYLGDNNSANGYATSFGVNSAAAYRATMIGYGATNISSGTDNVSIGYNASSAWQSVAIGETSTASGGGYTVAVGYNANASGYEGTALGAASIASGSTSTAVGYGASAAYQGTVLGSGASATGNNSTAIGFGATTSQANALVLGNSGVSVGIGTSTPGYKLDVSGDINFTGALRVSGNAGTSGYILQSNGTASPSWVSPSSLTVPNIYTADGTLAGTRNVTMNTNPITWNSTATTANPFTITANGVTSGYVLNVNATGLTSGSGIYVTGGSALTIGSLIEASGVVSANTVTYGLLNIANTAGSTTGKVATIQANSTAGSGINVLANGNVGIGYATPTTPTSTMVTDVPTSASTATLAVNGIVEAPIYTSQIQSLLPLTGTTYKWDVSLGSSAKVSVTTANSILNLTNIVEGQYGVLVVTNTVGSATAIGTVQIGGTTVSGNTAKMKVINAGGSALYFTPSVGAIDIISFFYDGSILYWTIGNNYN